MKAVVRIAGCQMTLQKDEVVRVPLLAADPGTTLRFEDVLMIVDAKGAQVGTPTVAGAAVDAELVRHMRGPKIEVATFKKRKDYRRHIGFRADYSEIRITGITPGSGASRPAAGK